MYQKARKELQDFYFSRAADWSNPQSKHPMLQEITDVAEASGETSAYKLKAIQYRVIAEKFTPKVFRNTPFYYEMATKNSYGDGSPFQPNKHPGGWLAYRNTHLMTDADPETYRLFMLWQHYRLHFTCGPYVDLVHYCFSYTNVVKNGLKGIYEQAEKQLKNCKTQKEREFIECGMAGLLAAKKIAERFAEEATLQLQAPDLTPEEKENLQLIADTAKRTPWEAPKTFYEALNCLAFFREVTGSIDGVGINAFGRPDVLLKPYYDRDIANGTLTKEKAKELLSKFLLIWDSHSDRDVTFDVRHPHEFEISLNLGGCDEKGNEVFNEITEMILTAHDELDCIFPKLMCRYSSKSDPKYLALMNKILCTGRSNIILVNDESVIPALEKSGKTPEDAKNYLASGCWDVTVEGTEKKPCAEYFNILFPLEAAVHKKDLSDGKITLSPVEQAKSFEELYAMVVGDILSLLDRKYAMTDIGYRLWSDVCPIPFYSIFMDECRENRKDVTGGGAKYNPGTVYFACFGNLINSFLAIKELCFDQKRYTLTELFEAVRNNWEGYEEMHQAVLSVHFFGDDSEESKELSVRLHNDLCDYAAKKKSFFGDAFNPGYLNYLEIREWGLKMGATPDGRKNGEPITHGIGPSRLRHIESPSTLINSLSAIDFTKCSASAVLNMVLPGNMTPELMDAVERAIATAGISSVHLNCVNKEDLLAAQKDPDNYRHIIVRVCGFSAQFVSLAPEWQEEFITRNFYGM